MVFNVCISNTDDHLRNHGFLLEKKGWRLSPAYDINPIPHSMGLKLNISETDNSLSLSLCKDVAKYFQVSKTRAGEIIQNLLHIRAGWKNLAKDIGASRNEMEIMQTAFEAPRE